MTLPGTSQVKKSPMAAVSLQYFCHKHISHILPVWIAGNGEVLPACRKCLEEEIKNPEPAKEAATSGQWVCMTNTCTKEAQDSFVCGFCGLHHCEKHFNPEDGICSGCEEKLL